MLKHIFWRDRHHANGRGTEMTITIVGIDEADLDRGQVSWLSPIARALMKAHQGDIVDLLAPAGVDQNRGARHLLRRIATGSGLSVPSRTGRRSA